MYFLHFLYRYIRAYKSYVLVSFFFFVFAAQSAVSFGGSFSNSFLNLWKIFFLLMCRAKRLYRMLYPLFCCKSISLPALAARRWRRTGYGLSGCYRLKRVFFTAAFRLDGCFQHDAAKNPARPYAQPPCREEVFMPGIGTDACCFYLGVGHSEVRELQAVGSP